MMKSRSSRKDCCVYTGARSAGSAKLSTDICSERIFTWPRTDIKEFVIHYQAESNSAPRNGRTTIKYLLKSEERSYIKTAVLILVCTRYVIFFLPIPILCSPLSTKNSCYSDPGWHSGRLSFLQPRNTPGVPPLVYTSYIYIYII